jgi:AcrR family transcriptional regulator
MDATASTAESGGGSHGSRVRLRILEMGLRLWLVDPAFVTARRIGQELGLTHGAVLYHFGHSAGLSNAIAFHAVKQGEERIIAQLILQKHKAVAHFTDAQRQAVLKAVG